MRFVGARERRRRVALACTRISSASNGPARIHAAYAVVADQRAPSDQRAFSVRAADIASHSLAGTTPRKSLMRTTRAPLDID